jgi:DNA polymerase-3 subunit gamma/tau
VSPSLADPAPTPTPVREPQAVSQPLDGERWLSLVAGAPLTGPARELAAHASFVGYDAGVLRLSLPALDEHLKSPKLVEQLANALARDLGHVPQIRFESATAGVESLHQRSTREHDARMAEAESAFLADAGVQQLINQHGAAIVRDSIRPLDD